MNIKKARVIYNPSSGREEAKKHLADILQTLEQMGYEASAFATKGNGDATREASRIASLRFDLVVAVGGDGTLNEVVNGIAEKEFRPKLMVLPLGTSNDFARAMGIPRYIPHALEVCKEGRFTQVDVGKMDKRYFINVAGGGSLTELSYEVPTKLKTALGQLAYYIKGAEKLSKFSPFSAEIEVNGNVFTEDIMLFLIANGSIIGGFDKLAPKAKMDDGLLDVFVLKKSNMAELARVVSLLLRGEQDRDPNILHYRTNHFSIKTAETIQINLDGELGGMTPCVFEILPKHIEVLTVY